MLPVIALGPRGGKIVGYGAFHHPIYQGSAEATKLEEHRHAAAAHHETGNARGLVETVRDWLRGLGFHSAEADGPHVDVSTDEGEHLSDELHVPFISRTPTKVRFRAADLAKHVGHGLPAPSHAAGTRWPVTKGSITVHAPGSAPASGQAWGAYPGPGYEADVDFKGNKYRVRFDVADGKFAGTLTLPNGVVEHGASPNKLVDKILLHSRGLPLDTNSYGMKKLGLAYSASRLFRFDDFKAEFADHHADPLATAPVAKLEEAGLVHPAQTHLDVLDMLKARPDGAVTELACLPVAVQDLLAASSKADVGPDYRGIPPGVAWKGTMAGQTMLVAAKPAPSGAAQHFLWSWGRSGQPMAVGTPISLNVLTSMARSDQPTLTALLEAPASAAPAAVGSPPPAVQTPVPGVTVTVPPAAPAFTEGPLPTDTVITKKQAKLGTVTLTVRGKDSFRVEVSTADLEAAGIPVPPGIVDPKSGKAVWTFKSLSAASDHVWTLSQGHPDAASWKQATGKTKIPSGGGWKFWGVKGVPPAPVASSSTPASDVQTPPEAAPATEPVAAPAVAESAAKDEAPPEAKARHITPEVLANLKVLYRSPDTLTLYGIPYEMREGQSPRDIYEYAKRSQQEALERPQHILAAKPQPFPPKDWVYLGEPGWFGHSNEADAQAAKAFVDKLGRDAPGDPHEWVRVADLQKPAPDDDRKATTKLPLAPEGPTPPPQVERFTVGTPPDALAAAGLRPPAPPRTDQPAGWDRMPDAKPEEKVEHTTNPDEHLASVISTFPKTFGLRAYPGETFRIGHSESYVTRKNKSFARTGDDPSTWEVTLYTQIRAPGGKWQDFVKGTPDEVRSQMVPLKAEEAKPAQETTVLGEFSSGGLHYATLVSQGRVLLVESANAAEIGELVDRSDNLPEKALRGAKVITTEEQPDEDASVRQARALAVKAGVLAPAVVQTPAEKPPKAKKPRAPKGSGDAVTLSDAAKHGVETYVTDPVLRDRDAAIDDEDTRDIEASNLIHTLVQDGKLTLPASLTAAQLNVIADRLTLASNSADADSEGGRGGKAASTALSTLAGKVRALAAARPADAPAAPQAPSPAPEPLRVPPPAPVEPPAAVQTPEAAGKPMHRYGVNLRPPGQYTLGLKGGEAWELAARGTHPASTFPGRPELPVSKRFPHGEVLLPRKLTAEEENHFDLTPLDEPAPAKTPAAVPGVGKWVGNRWEAAPLTPSADILRAPTDEEMLDYDGPSGQYKPGFTDHQARRHYASALKRDADAQVFLDSAARKLAGGRRREAAEDYDEAARLHAVAAQELHSIGNRLGDNEFGKQAHDEAAKYEAAQKAALHQADLALSAPAVQTPPEPATPPVQKLPTSPLATSSVMRPPTESENKLFGKNPSQTMPGRREHDTRVIVARAQQAQLDAAAVAARGTPEAHEEAAAHLEHAADLMREVMTRTGVTMETSADGKTRWTTPTKDAEAAFTKERDIRRKATEQRATATMKRTAAEEDAAKREAAAAAEQAARESEAAMAEEEPEEDSLPVQGLPPVPTSAEAEMAAAKEEKDPAVSRQRAREVGEHIVSSRKDMADLITRVKSGELDKVSYADAAKLVRKENVMPVLNRDHYRSVGASPGCAHLALTVASLVTNKPKDSDEERKSYLNGVRLIAGGLQDVKTTADVEAFADELREMVKTAGRKMHAASAEEFKFMDGSSDYYARDLNRTRLAHLLGVKDPNDVEGIRMVGGVPTVIWTDRAERMAVHDMFRALGSRFAAGMYLRLPEDSSAAHYEWKRPKFKASHEYAFGRARAEAAVYDADGWDQYTAKDEAKKTQAAKAADAVSGEAKPEKPKWEKVVASRPETLGAAHPVRPGTGNADRLASSFGLKGVQPGENIPDTEYEHHLRHAEMALYDLADVIGATPKQMSLNGRLGMAFAARGRGGKRAAAAHYESGTKAINLTRFAGAGTLAHEWGHFLDNIMAEVYGEKGTAGRGTFASESARSWTGSDVPVPLRNALMELDRAINVADPSTESATRKAKLDEADKLSKQINAKVAMLNDSIRSRDRSPEAVAKRDVLRAEYDALREQYNQVRKIDTTRSTFHMHAINLSGGKVKGYWNEGTEKFARAFESFIQDSLEDHGRRNSYLVDGTRGKLFTGEVDIHGEQAQPYPQGEERKRINAAFTKLMEVLRDGGHLEKAMLYLDSPDSLPSSTRG